MKHHTVLATSPHRRPLIAAAGLIAFFFTAASVFPEEGLWTFDNFPSREVARRYGFNPTPDWLERVKLSSARIAGGCSASFVSPDGLVMTNHHCVEGCLEDLSTTGRDLIENGFTAKLPGDEERCPAFEIDQLVDVQNVTAQVLGATKGLEGEALIDARRAVKSKVESSCGTSEEVHCEMVSLYGGGMYHLYKYRRFKDVRLVFAPEYGIGFFGGDPDNFNFPRFDLDVGFVRVYDNGKPARTPRYFPFAPSMPPEGTLVFVSGNPGSTARLKTISELEFERDQAVPNRLFLLAELRGLLTQFGEQSAEQKRISRVKLFGVENSFKGAKGRFRALTSPEVFTERQAQERWLRTRVAENPDLEKAYGGAWDAVAKAKREFAEIEPRYGMLENASAFNSELFGYARKLVRAAEELQKPDEKRFPEFQEAQLTRLKENLMARAPIYPDLEIATLSFSLTKLREELGTDDPFVKKLLGPHSPREVAARAVNGSTLGDPVVRRRLLDGGAKAIEASDDSMIQFASAVDPQSRAIRKHVEDDIDSVIIKNNEAIAKARFAVLGTSVYPDATFSPRLSFGAIRGWSEAGRPVAPFTTFAGLFERATGRDPFALPQRWLDAKGRIDLSVPLDFVTTNDIIGGNSGSPMIDREARVVGLVFDSNLPGLGGDYVYDEKTNRTVGVCGVAILEALAKVYDAERLAGEIRAASSKTPPAATAPAAPAAP